MATAATIVDSRGLNNAATATTQLCIVSSTMFENVRKSNYFFYFEKRNLLLFVIILETRCGGLPWPLVWSFGIRCGQGVALRPEDRNEAALM